MAEYQVKLTGWQVAIGGLVLLGIIGVRVTTFSDQRDNKALMEQLEILLIEDYFPNDVDRLKSALESGNEKDISSVATSIVSTKLDIISVSTSYPLFEFSSKKKVIVKVTYALKDIQGTRKMKTNYYRFDYGAIGNSWQYRYESSAFSYYMNFS